MGFPRQAPVLRLRVSVSVANTIQELYEALWDELYLRSKANGFRIRSIWIADAAHQNQSVILNEEKLGNDRKFSKNIPNYS
jgi:hypothetical protein